MNKDQSITDLHAAIDAEANGLPWQFKSKHNDWMDAPPPACVCSSAAHNFLVRAKPVWVLPDPPVSQQWHRTDWLESDLPSGYRPLLKGEKRQAQDEYTKHNPTSFLKVANPLLQEVSVDYTNYKTRTTRPLPRVQTFRPWTSNETLGKHLINKFSKDQFIVTAIIAGRHIIGGVHHSLEQIHEGYTQLDGSPCVTEFPNTL